MQRAGIELTHVPYRGGGELFTALLGKQVDVVADASGWAPMVSEGRFRLLVVWGATRMPRFPDVPTLRESGIDLVVDSPYGIGGPRGMDPAVVARLHDAFRDALDEAAVRAVMERFNLPRLYLDTAAFEAAQPASFEAERAGLRRAGLLPAGR
jgi:tripartite-type tricarboxylate transporter receptor subunit TctC